MLTLLNKENLKLSAQPGMEEVSYDSEFYALVMIDGVDAETLCTPSRVYKKHKQRVYGTFGTGGINIALKMDEMSPRNDA